MTVVVDASVAVKWFVEEEGREAAMKLFRSTIEKWAPDIVFAEVANVLRRKVRKGEASATQAHQAIETLPDLFSQVVPSADLIRDAWWIAEALDHSVYDCLYLACAEQRGSTLVTADGRFFDKARSRGRGSRVIPLSAVAGL